MKKQISLLLILVTTIFTSSCAVVGIGAVGGAILMSEERRLPGKVVDDQILEYQVNEAIYAELRNKADISITSYNGVVLLTGEANSQSTIQRAVELVRLYARSNVEIVNEIMLGQPTAFSEEAKDTILTAKVKSVIIAEIADKQAQNSSENDNIDYSSLSISVKVVSHRSTVYLLGILSKPEQDFVKNTVSRVAGVQKVVSIFQDWDQIQEKQRQRIGKIRQQQSEQKN